MARRNSRGLELSFKRADGGPRGRWYKVISGKPEYFGWGNGVSDRQSYNEALEKYRQFKAAKVKPSQIPPETGRSGTLPSGPSSKPAHTFAQYAELEADWHKAVNARAFDTPLNWRDYKSKLLGTKQAAGVLTGTLIDQFVADQRKRKEARKRLLERRKQGEKIGEPKQAGLSDERFLAIQSQAKWFKELVGNETWDGTEQTAARLLKTWRDASEAKIVAGTHKPNWFNERIKFARQFVGWAERTYHLDRLPRNLKQLCAKYSYEGSPKAIDPQSLLALWNGANDLEKTWILLSINCGFKQQDISDLTGSMLQGTHLDFTRGKTLFTAETPVNVKYKLWKTTRTYIAQTRTSQEPNQPLFTGESGEVLVRHVPGRKDPDKTVRVDLIRNHFFHLCQDTHVTGYSFTNLRDTSITLIEGMDRSYSDLFAAHADGRMARYYVDDKMVDTSGLDRIIDRLRIIYRSKYKLPV